MTILQSGVIPSTGGYQIERSLRFNSADSANLTRTFSAGSRTTWTLSMWLKRSAFSASAARDLFTVNNGTTDATYFVIAIRETDKLRIEGFNTNFRETTQVLRDVSAWYHLVVTVDTTNATAGNRIRMYLNGAEITTFSTSNNPTSSQSLGVNQAATHKIGALTSTYFDGYMTEINFIDGQALTPSSFGETDSATGVWKPKAYSGTYGTNGFYLKFADNSGTTSTTLGKDSSGNGNNWTPNNFSVTAGVGNDSMVDSPTAYGTDTGVGGEVRGNYCTWNPLYGSTPTLTNGNLDATTNNTTAYGTVSVTSGKWYWEILVGNASYIGVMDSTYIKPDGSWSSQAIAYVSNGNKYNGTGSAYGASYTTNDIIGVALDMDAGTIVFYKNGSSQGTAFSSGIAGKEFRPFVYSSTSGTQTANFGQRAFAYTAPSGFKALCTTNLPTPTIGATSTTQANDYFDATLYTGTGSDLAIVNSGGMAPDFVWVKVRSQAYSHNLNDIIRGTNNRLQSDTTAAAGTGGIVSFNSNGFTARGSVGELGANGDTYVAWQWKGGGTGVTNTAGTITSTVSANTTSGFSIATFTQLSGSPYIGTVGHGLGVAPSMVIIKDRSIANGWLVYHSALGATKYIVLSSTAAAATGSNAFNNTAPTSTVFTTAAGSTYWGNAGATAVAYCFANVEGYSRAFSYTGNGSTDGPFVYLGFRPRYILVKVASNQINAANWQIWDTSRQTYNVASDYLFANTSDAESNSAPTYHSIDLLSNGFKLRSTDTYGVNQNGATYIGIAFAESPFKYSLGR